MFTVKLLLVAGLVPALGTDLVWARPTPDGENARPSRNGFDRLDAAAEEQCRERMRNAGNPFTLFEEGSWKNPLPADRE